MLRTFLLITFFLTVYACDKDAVNSSEPAETNASFISAVDISGYPEITISNPIFYDLNGSAKGFLNILKDNGVNTIRLKLWVKPISPHSGFDEVKTFSKTLKSQGFKIWLTIHYSDTWADPGHQETPEQWQELDHESLKETVYEYTAKVVKEIAPHYIQIGNEINHGFLHPNGDITSNYQNFLSLLNEGCAAVRANSDSAKIILHFAGLDGATWFYNQVKTIDYDIIGLSFYPLWHGKSLNGLKSTMHNLSLVHDKEIIIAETAYPFTLEWNDWTNNIVGLESQLILPDYPATPTGQKDFINAIKTLTESLDKGIGFCYWGAELIAWKGDQSQEASPWENQALFDFNNKALPVLTEFNTE